MQWYIILFLYSILLLLLLLYVVARYNAMAYLFSMYMLPAINVREYISIKSPLVWLFVAAIVGFFTIVITQQNENLFFAIYNLSGKNTGLDFLMIICAQYLFACIIFIAFVYGLVKQKSSSYFITILSVLIVSYLLAKIATHILIDVRPYMLYHLMPLVPVSADNGFPSDHTLLSFAVALSVFLFSKKIGWLLLALAFAVGIGRIYVAAHHPIDVIGSIGIVCMAVFIILSVFSLVRRLRRYS